MHVPGQAIRLADDVIFMFNEEIIKKGDPHTLSNNPQTHRLKEYLVEGN